MVLLLISFVAGVLTVLAPCVLPLLPVIVGSVASGRSRSTPYVVVISLSLSVIAFTYILKVSSIFVKVPQEFWTYFSGGILALFGLTLVFPVIWEKIPGLYRLSVGSNKLLGTGYQKHNLIGDAIVGASLGPIFSSCSPTYFVILASVLPASFALGTLYLLSYTLGMGLVLLLVSILGERLVRNLSVVSDPNSWFKKVLGLLFILLGIVIALGYEKRLETSILNSGYLDVTKIEQKLLEWNKGEVKSDSTYTSTQDNDASTTPSTSSSTVKVATTKSTKAPKNRGIPYIEIAQPAGYVNTGDKPFKIGDYVGKKVILIDFMTYSCINCQRTFPYMVSWYEKYKDQGFIAIGIHTPEFAFEKDKDNVQKALSGFGITFPVVLDNSYGTWNAFGNSYWPRKYLIDIYGNIVYDHAGEGAYDEIEKKIQELLKERGEVLGEQPVRSSSVNSPNSQYSTLTLPGSSSNGNFAASPETYFGSARNYNLGSGKRGQTGTQDITLAAGDYEPNILYLAGLWNIQPEYAESSSGSKAIFYYSAKDVYLVASSASDQTATIEVWQDGNLISDSNSGEDVKSAKVSIKESRLYKIIHNTTPGEHVLELRIKGTGVRLYTFTFG